MAFSKAKRFVYKIPEDVPSPADYVVTTTFEKGCSIPKSPRFPQQPKEEEQLVTCPRFQDHSRGSVRCTTSNSEKDDNNRLNLLKRRIIEFNRNDIRRQSIRRKSLKNNEKPSKSNANQHNNVTYYSENLLSPGYLGFIDDNYDSFISLEGHDELRELEEHEFNEQHKLLMTNKERKRFINELERIERKVDDVRRVVAMLCRRPHNNETKNVNVKKQFQKQLFPTSPDKCEEINRIIKNSIRSLRRQIEIKGKSTNIEILNKVQNLFMDIYRTSQQSIDEINALCNNTAELLSQHVRNILNGTTASAAQCTSCSRNASAVEGNYFTDRDTLAYENLCSGITSHVQHPQEDTEPLENGDLDITIKLEKTQEKLELQGALLQSFKEVLSEIKENLV